MKTSSLQRVSTSAKDYHCLAEDCSMPFTNKEVAHSHILVAHSHMGALLPWIQARWLLPTWSDPFQNQVGILQTFGQYPWCGPGHLIQAMGWLGCGVQLHQKGQHKRCQSGFKIHHFSHLSSRPKGWPPYLNILIKIFSSPSWTFHSLLFNTLGLKFQSFLCST